MVRETIPLNNSTQVIFQQDEIKQLDELLELSGHSNCEDGPRTSHSVMTVLDTDIATWPLSKLRETHKFADIHIVPAKDPSMNSCCATTCEDLGINMEQLREVHGKSFQLNTDMLQLNFQS